MTAPVVVIAAAGLGSRFAAAGYLQPKPMIPFRGKSLLFWSLVGVRQLLERSQTIVVVPEDSVLSSFITQTFGAMELPLPDIREVVAPTSGQADTVRLALRDAESSRPLTIWNIDTYLKPGSFIAPSGNWMHLFPNSSESLSYARLGDGLIREVAEKRVISNWASSGLYGFASIEAYLDCYKRLYGDHESFDGETYVAPLYNVLLGQGFPVFPVTVPHDAVIPLGTPEDLHRCAERGLLSLSEQSS